MRSISHILNWENTMGYVIKCTSGGYGSDRVRCECNAISIGSTSGGDEWRHTHGVSHFGEQS